MPLNNACLDIGATAMKNAITHVAMHTADPGAGGSSPATSARQPVTWGAVANGDFSMTGSLNFTGGAASGACTYAGFWSAVSGGTFYGSQALTGDQTFNALGEYTVTALTVNGSS